MRLNREHLDHVIFLAETILANRKRALMPDALQCLLYIVKALDHADLPEEPAKEIALCIRRIEEELIEENRRLAEIKRNLSHAKQIRRSV